MKKYSADDNNDCYKYAALRNILYRKGKSVEMLVSYDPSFTMMGEWFKQLFGESEARTIRVYSICRYILYRPALTWSVHSGRLAHHVRDRAVGQGAALRDYHRAYRRGYRRPELSGRSDRAARQPEGVRGTLIAHMDGGTPNIILEIDRTDAWHFGYSGLLFREGLRHFRLPARRKSV